MNADLHLLITILTTGKEMLKVAVKIPGGHDVLHDWECFREPDVVEEYLHFIPQHVAEQMDVILEVEQITEVVAQRLYTSGIHEHKPSMAEINHHL